MKIQERKNIVLKGNLDNNQEFCYSLKNSAKVFDVLSSQIYSDKISAIIRELSTNAYDSHVEADNINRPFDIHLPTPLNPYFEIRDYGTGMSHEKIINVYSQYFNSDKENSNDYVGCLGLGSKSPFCYVDSFVIESIYNGTRFNYIAYKDEMGVPTLNHIVSENTVEPNGLKINFAVNDNDMSEFYTKAANIFRYFNIRPNFVGKQINIPDIGEPYIKSKDKNWAIYKPADESEKINLIMGQICYPVDTTQLKIDNLQQVTNLYSVVLHANLGDVSFNVSRENLEYTNKTKNYLTEQLKNCIENIRTLLQQKVNKHENFLSAFSFAFEENILSMVDNYNGMIFPLRPNCYKDHASSKKYYKSWGGTVKCTSFNGIDLTSDIIYNDCKKFIKNRVEKILEQNKSITLVSFKNKSDLNKFETQFMTKLKKLSSFEVDLTKATVDKIECYKLTRGYCHSFNKSSWDMPDKLSNYHNQQNVYVLMDRWDADIEFGICRFAQRHFNIDIYGIRRSSKHKLDDNWIYFNDFLEEQRDCTKEEIDIQQYYNVCEPLNIQLLKEITHEDWQQFVSAVSYIHSKLNFALKYIYGVEQKIPEEMKYIKTKYPDYYQILTSNNAGMNIINIINKIGN